MSVWPLAIRLARRELRSGLSGFRIFFLCLVLGVAAIAGIGSLAAAMLTGMAEQGRVLLGGDVAVQLVHRPATKTERSFLDSHGKVSQTVSMRAMAYALKGGVAAERQLIELKAADGAWPLYGTVGLSPAAKLDAVLACPSAKPGAACGVAAEQSLLDRLHLSRGGNLRIGAAVFRISAILTDEPDRLSGGFSLGPHVLMSREGLQRTGLVTLGSLIEYGYRVALPARDSITEFKQQAAAAFPDGGWEIRDRNNAAPGTRRFVEQVSMFLTLVGLTVLAVGGVGAGQAVRAFLDRKRDEIATLKALGAEGDLVFLVFFLQVMTIALVAVFAGAILGAVLPFAIQTLAGADIPLPTAYAVYAEPLAMACVFGIFSAMAFAILPLARAREIPPAALFRDIVSPAGSHGRLPYLISAAACGSVVVALALAISPSLFFAAWFLGGTAGILVVLRIVAAGVKFVLPHLPRRLSPALRLALSNLTRPGSTAAGIIVALGLGLTLLATVTLLDSTITTQVKDSLPGTAPSFFFIDIQPKEAAGFDAAIARFASAREYKRTPMIRGRIVALNGIAARDARVASDSRWALSGDRGITYAATPPGNAAITEGRWWPANYTGPTLISFDAELAKGMNLKLGDRLTLNVLGRKIEGRIANLRDVNFASGNQNFILILSPGLIDKAPHSFLATVRVAPRDEEPLYRAITDRFRNVSAIRVKDAIEQVNGLLRQLAAGVRVASLVTVLAGLLVLAGAIAAGQRARLYDATIMKVLGATRAQIAAVYAMEYGLLGVVAGLIALGAGSAAAYAVASRVFDVPFSFDLRAVLLTVIGGGMATLLFGLGAAWAALAAKPAALLRNP